MRHGLGTEFRRVENREHLGKEAIVAVAVRTYDTTVEDLWEAVTSPERLIRWFLPVEGDLRVGGRYQLKGNASGTITRCDQPVALDVTWEFMGGVSWVHLRLAADGERTRLTLEHIAPKDGIGEDHLKKYGPSAVGVGWDLWLLGLANHLVAPEAQLDHEAVEAWTASPEGYAFLRECGEAWAVADAASGEDLTEATAKAERTIAFYAGT